MNDSGLSKDDDGDGKSVLTRRSEGLGTVDVEIPTKNDMLVSIVALNK